MKINSQVKPLVFEEDGRRVLVSYDNRGEPFREGVNIMFEPTSGPVTWVLLDTAEVIALRNKLNEFLGLDPKRPDLVDALPSVHCGHTAQQWAQMAAAAAKKADTARFELDRIKDHLRNIAGAAPHEAS